MKENFLLNRIKGIVLGKEVKLEQATLDNGTVIEADMLEAGSPVFIVTEDGQVALPVGDYTLEDGRVLVVSEEGIIAEIKEAATEEESPEVEVEVEASEAQPEYVTKEDFLTAIGEIKSLFTSQLDAKAKEIEVEESKETELSAQPMPAATPIKPNPERETAKKEQMVYAKKQVQSLESKIMAKFANLKLN